MNERTNERLLHEFKTNHIHIDYVRPNDERKNHMFAIVHVYWWMVWSVSLPNRISRIPFQRKNERREKNTHIYCVHCFLFISIFMRRRRTVERMLVFAWRIEYRRYCTYDKHPAARQFGSFTRDKIIRDVTFFVRLSSCCALHCRIRIQSVCSVYGVRCTYMCVYVLGHCISFSGFSFENVRKKKWFHVWRVQQTLYTVHTWEDNIAHSRTSHTHTHMKSESERKRLYNTKRMLLSLFYFFFFIFSFFMVFSSSASVLDELRIYEYILYRKGRRSALYNVYLALHIWWTRTL